ncbi:MAG TPA: 6-carboxytetrahydropterin synthase [Phycisphaerae bacterium]|nr:6-carboxytetrahydropterin synthase [Phycisphaerae bacterium]
MFAIEVQSTFSAAHALRLPDGRHEALHGHDFHVTVRIGADQLDALETVADFHDIHDALTVIVAPWRNRNLNDIEPFKTRVNPSAERIAEHIGIQLATALATADREHSRHLRLLEVRVTEAPQCVAIWRPE